MNEFDLTKLNDTLAEPPEELKSRTLAAMRAEENGKTAHRRPVRRTIAVCAAVLSAALVLMGAGVKVFDYLAFVPGMGVVTADQAEVYTLDTAVEAGRYRIEAASMIPVTEGEYEGMWQVTLLTDMSTTEMRADNGETRPVLTLTDADGNFCDLMFDGGTSMLTYFKGYADFRGSGDYTLTWYGKDYTMTMKTVENTEWGDYSFPVADGITVMAFPMSAGSRYLAFDVILDAENANLQYWAEQSGYMNYLPQSVTITDTKGNEFYVSQKSGHGIPVPESEREHGVNALLDFRIEHVLRMDEIPEYPIAKIEISGLEIRFEMIEDSVFYKTAVPEPDEAITAEKLPNGGVFYDSHGFRLSFDSVTTCAGDGLNEYILEFSGHASCDIWETITDTAVLVEYISGKSLSAGENDYYGGTMTHSVYDGSFTSKRRISGGGSKKNNVVDIDFGEEINLRLSDIYLTVENGWTIDFTAPNTTE